METKQGISIKIKIKIKGKEIEFSEEEFNELYGIMGRLKKGNFTTIPWYPWTTDTVWENPEVTIYRGVTDSNHT